MRPFMMVSALVALLCCAGPGFTQGKEPPKKPENTQIMEVGGKTLDKWIEEAKHKDASRRSQAIHMILYFGPDRAYQAVPVLLAELKKHSADYPLDTSVRHNLVLTLGMIIGGVKQADIKDLREATTIFKRLLKDPQVMVKYRAVQALGFVGEDAKGVALDLLPLIKDPATWEIRQAACVSLGQIAADTEKGPDPKIIEALYLAAIKDNTQQVRLAAVQSLAYLGAPANKVMTAELLKYLDIIAAKDPEPMVQIWAHMAVMSITRTFGEDRMGSIIQIAVKSDRSDCKIQACNAMGAIGAKAKSMAPGIIRMLADKDYGVVYAAMQALVQMEAQTAVPVLEKMAADTKLPDYHKKAAKEALDQLQSRMKNPTKEKK